ncbi:MAG: tRNA dihydrouridine synthase DusB [Gammaproteobacteria bacterium]|nr:tRNA dihydrouridine synthase DusB [Gammaproteobacteria bacterium]
MRIGSLPVDNNLFLAPMAGVTDRPFRQLCRVWGAGLAFSEMVSAQPELRRSRKSKLRTDHQGESGPRAVQIVGTDPDMMADAARYNVARGAQIIDINMGCPAKKVCKVNAGSALMAEPRLVRRILAAVVAAVPVPVTLKSRTGVDPDHRNAVEIARIAEGEGVAAVTVHGRTRACGYRGDAEYQTVAAVKQAVSIPVVVNGDITSPQTAARALQASGADALMVGRGAQGRPWLFTQIGYYLVTGRHLPEPEPGDIYPLVLAHIGDIHQFYGPVGGLGIARKHFGWYLAGRPGGAEYRRKFNELKSVGEQLVAIERYFSDDGVMAEWGRRAA